MCAPNPAAFPPGHFFNCLRSPNPERIPSTRHIRSHPTRSPFSSPLLLLRRRSAWQPQTRCPCLSRRFACVSSARRDPSARSTTRGQQEAGAQGGSHRRHRRREDPREVGSGFKFAGAAVQASNAVKTMGAAAAGAKTAAAPEASTETESKEDPAEAEAKAKAEAEAAAVAEAKAKG